jgi:hypothetical protein
MSKPRPTVDLGYPTPAHGRIPSFNSIEEESAFWDTHDTADFPDEFTLIEVTFEGYPALDVTFALDRLEAAELARRAKEIGVPPSTLLHMWVKERLNQGATGS